MSNYRLIARIALAGAFLATPLASVSADSETCFERARLQDYDPALIRAMQSRLHERGLYSGPIDGKSGPGTRQALARLTGLPPRSEFRLETELVQQIFGPNHPGIYYASDQDQLMRELGVTPDPRYRNPCRRVRVVDR
ncbi:MAG TPA: peptidoglycan-binding protein [Sphingomicrobium sp.]|nr:peptidoglycan-binding protein [Sphingomicrobium sp.]